MLHNITRFFVGALFIFSGLIKLNDPIGTAIKLEEYFEVFSSDFAQFFHAFIPWALPIAIVLCIAEVVLGVALLVGFRNKTTILLLALMIVFFTFLTFYSAYFNKVTDCGCFGDAIPLTPWQSFSKDVVLSVLIGFLMISGRNKRKVVGYFPAVAVSLSVAFCSYLAYYVLIHQPIIDFRPYKVGNHLPTLMKPLEPCQYTYILEKDGKEYEFSQYPADAASYKFIRMITLNEKACLPKITDLHLQSAEGEDFTELGMTGGKLWIVVQKIVPKGEGHLDEISALAESLQTGTGIEPIIITSDGNDFETFKAENQLANVPHYYVDATVLKAMVRSNPGIMLLNDGKVLGKWHHNDTPSPEDVLRLLK